jgi:hypothetical protein
VPRRFGYRPRPHRGAHFLHRHGFPTGESYTSFELRHSDGPHFIRRGSRPTGSNREVQKTVNTYSGRMLSAGFMRFISQTLALSHRPLLVLYR